MYKRGTSFLFILLIFGISNGIQAQSNEKATKSGAKTAIMNFERDTWSAVKNQNIKLLKSILAENYTGMFSRGFFKKKQQLKFVKSVRIRSYDLKNITVNTPRKDLVVINYTLSLEGTYKGDPFRQSFYANSTWLKTGKRWKMIQHGNTKMDK